MGRLPHGLETLELIHCEIDLQRLVDMLGANARAPKSLYLNTCRRHPGHARAESLGSILVPLLGNPRTTDLYLNYAHLEMPSSCNIKAIKATFESNRNLESPIIESGLVIEKRAELALLFQGFAAAPKLRSLGFQVTSPRFVKSQKVRKKVCQRFASLSQQYARKRRH
jgi:hypothetical protein